jgi:hypothetical protein
MSQPRQGKTNGQVCHHLPTLNGEFPITLILSKLGDVVRLVSICHFKDVYESSSSTKDDNQLWNRKLFFVSFFPELLSVLIESQVLLSVC